ncbi:MAG: DUF1223 domain-containing protein [Hyphomicrobiaceae bacterium]
MTFNRFAILFVTAALFVPLDASSKFSRADAAEIKSVLELYTSQGCSSCPRADALLKNYVDRKDVLALTLPVDYWDYLGWKDTFAKHDYSMRQRLYAKARGDGQVYTPQVVVNGLTHAVGSRKGQIDKAIAVTQKRLAARRISATLSMNGEDLVIEANERGADSQAPERCRVWLARVQKKGTVNIKRGENGGRKLTYYNIVRQMQPVGTWTGEKMTIRLPAKGLTNAAMDTYAVIFQEGPAGPIVGAAEISTQ